MVIPIEPGDNSFKFICKKMKYAREFTERRFGFVEAQARDGRTSRVIVPITKVDRTSGQLTDNQVRILACLDASFGSDGAKATDIAQDIHIPRTTVSDALKILKGREYVSVSGKGSLWSLTDKGRKALKDAQLAAQADEDSYLCQDGLLWVIAIDDQQ